MTASLLTASSMILLLARACGARPLASHLAFRETTSAGRPRPRFRALILNWPREKWSSSSFQTAPRAGARG
eukprot:6104607-Lingulodinium_polyedra.AAC.1